MIEDFGDSVEIVQEWPPRIDEIRETFGDLPDGVVFAWENKIYSPSTGTLANWIVEHENVHMRQQEAAGGVNAWWDRYLVDPAWRLSQELEAHQVEYREFCKFYRDRNVQARYLNEIAGRLSSPMYGKLISRGDAMRQIRRGK